MTIEVKSQNIDHLGLIAGVCQELNLASLANTLLGRRNEHAKVSVGDAIVALILNGFGFVNRSLYMTSQFFEGRPLSLLLGKEIAPEDLNDDTLGRALDVIADFGPEKLFGSLAFEIGSKRKLIGKSVHLDTTSVSLQGEYDHPEQEGVISIVHGYSKDHRQDLKQFILSMTVTGAASLPIWIETLDGKASDKNSFHETIARIRTFQGGLQEAKDFLWVADSALYSKDKLLTAAQLRWLTRVPETVKECRDLVEKESTDLKWEDLGDGYKVSATTSEFGGINQRWLLVFSEKAYEREKATFERNLEKTEEKFILDLWHFENKVFASKEVGHAALEAIQAEYPLHNISVNFEPVSKFEQKGRPSADSQRRHIGFQAQVSDVAFNSEKADILLNKKGRFVLATNELDASSYTDSDLLREYKSQQDVERGFRFLKDSEFGISDVFLKNPRRIMALMAVMSLCLMVYNIAQFELRDALEMKQETLPNQLGKPTTRPTLRWVFQLFQNIAVVHITGHAPVITNMTPLRTKILGFFPSAVGRIYGIEAPPGALHSNNQI